MLLLLLCSATLLPASAQSGRAGVWNANSASSTSSSSSSSDSGPGYTLHYDPRTRQYYRVPKARAVLPVCPPFSGCYPAAGTGNYSRWSAGHSGAHPVGGTSSASRTSASRVAAYPAAGIAAGTSAVRGTSDAKAQVRLLDYHESVDGRSFLVHLPQTYQSSNPTPVVIVFHGLGMNGTSVRGLSAMDITAEKNGFITVYPDGVGGRWNDGVQPGGGADDVTFVSDMLDAMAKKYRIDSRRIYACGISNGGFFVQKLACELSNRIAAIGVVAASAGANVCARCNTHRGMPVVFFLGTDDPIIPREGQSKELGKLGDALGLTELGIKNIDSTVAKVGGIMTADEAGEFWAKNNGCAAHARPESIPDRDTRDGCRVSRDTYGGGIGGSDVVIYDIEGGGHSWPGGMGFVAKDIIGRTCNDINASDIMWQFFRSHSR